MKTIILFVAAAMSLSTAFGSDPGFEERFKMKTGRYTPAEEARREKASIAARQAQTKPVMNCDKHECCTRTEQLVAESTTTLGDPGAEARFQTKFGRISPAEEARISAAKRPTAESVLLASARTCEGACCKHYQ